MKLNAMLKQSKNSLLFETDTGEFDGESEDITKNLFKVCCAIMNLRPKQRGKNPMDDNLLWKYLEHINETKLDRDTLIID